MEIAMKRTERLVHQLVPVDILEQMFENVTAQTREDAQGNFHNPALDMLRGSIAMEKLRNMAASESGAGALSAQQKELLSTMPVTRQLLTGGGPVESHPVQAVYMDTTRSIKYFSAIVSGTRRFEFDSKSVLPLEACMAEWSFQVAALSSAFFTVLASCLASSRQTPCVGTVSTWGAIYTATSVLKSAGVGTWVKYSLDPVRQPADRRLGCIRLICRCGADKLTILIQCARIDASFQVGGSEARRVILIDEFDIVQEPATLASIRCAPVHHDCPRSIAPCRCERVNPDLLQIVHCPRDVNFFLDQNFASVNTW